MEHEGLDEDVCVEGLEEDGDGSDEDMEEFNKKTANNRDREANRKKNEERILETLDLEAIFRTNLLESFWKNYQQRCRALLRREQRRATALHKLLAKRNEKLEKLFEETGRKLIRALERGIQEISGRDQI